MPDSSLGRAILVLTTDPEGFIKGVNKAKGSAEGFAGSIGSVTKALGVLGATTAIVGFARSVLADADALTRLHDQTSISVRGLQQLRTAGDSAGNSIDEITRAIGFMQKGLGGNDQAFLRALKDLGLNADELRKLAPEQQFMAIGDALRAVRDPAQQVALAIATLGKTGDDVLPTIKQGFDGVKNSAAAMSDEAVFALDAIGDMMTATVRSGKGVVVEWIASIFRPWIQHWQLTAEAAKLYQEQLDLMRSTVNDPAFRDVAKAAPFTVGLPSETKQKALEKEAEDHLRKIEQLRAATEKKAAADRIQRAADERAFYNMIGEREIDTAQRQHDLVVEREAELRRFYNWLGERELEAWRPELLKGIFADQSLGMQGLADGTRRVIEHTVTWRDTLADVVNVLGVIGDRWASLAVGILRNAQAIAALWNGQRDANGQLIPGTRNRTAAIGSAIGAVGQFIPTSTTAGKIGYGAAQGAAVGSVFGPIGMGVGAGIGALIGWYQSGKAARQLNDVRDAFVAQAGGLRELDRRAHAAGVTLKAMLDAKNVTDYQRAIDDLKAALQFQDQTWQDLQDAIEKYGFSVDELGPALSQKLLDQRAMDLIREFRLLEGAGINVENISLRMRDALNKYFQDALRTGAKVPAAFREILHQLAVMGLLYDENGNQVTDLENSGIHFAETLDDKFATLIESIQKMIEAIERLLGLTKDADAAINGLPKPPGVPGVPQIPGNPRLPEINALPNGVYGRRFSGTGDGTTVIVEIDRRVMAEWLVPELPGAITRLGLGR